MSCTRNCCARAGARVRVHVLPTRPRSAGPCCAQHFCVTTPIDDNFACVRAAGVYFFETKLRTGDGILANIEIEWMLTTRIKTSDVSTNGYEMWLHDVRPRTRADGGVRCLLLGS